MNPPAVSNVLIIGEDPKQTELYADLIREVADCQIDLLSRNPETAADWIGRSPYQLVVVDSTPTLDGLALLERVKRLSPETSVVVVADPASVEHAVAAVKMGAEDYLRKPFNLEPFQLAVKRGLDRKAVFGGNAGASAYLGLLNACQLVSSALDQRKVFEIVQSYLRRELSSRHTAVYTVDLKGTGEAISRVDDPGPEDKRDRAMDEILEIALQALAPLPRMAQAGDAELYRFIDRGQLTPGLFIFKFKCTGPADFFCVCLSPERPSPMESFEGRLRMLRAQIEVTGHNIDQYMGVQSLAYVDDVTGLYNTRYLHATLDREIELANATGRHFAVLFIDADKFKGVNDSFGHLVGSKLLNALGTHLKGYLRDSDTVFRYGGDEFVAVLSPCDLPTAKGVAERIRASVEETAFLAEDGIDLRFTVSIGVALFPDHAASKQAVIDAADRAMYIAKRKTRNMVFIADMTPPPATASAAAPATAPAPAPAPAGLTRETAEEKTREKKGPEGGDPA